MQNEFERNLGDLAAVFELVGRFCDEQGIDARTRWIVELTLEELFANVVRHNPDGRGAVLIELDRVGDRVTMAVTDFDSDRFDPNEAKTPDLDVPLEKRRPGGLGIHLVRTMTDELRYEYADRVSRTIVTKKLG
jgi:anti-sigma regulatory factor (Ser/Thr protein kinase)